MMIELAAEGMIGIGLFFLLVGSLGILRFEDVYLRLQASSKSITFGMGFLLLGTGALTGEPLLLAKAAVAVAFLFLTSPIAAHMIARSALRSGHEPVKLVRADQIETGDQVRD